MAAYFKKKSILGSLEFPNKHKYRSCRYIFRKEKIYVRVRIEMSVKNFKWIFYEGFDKRYCTVGTFIASVIMT